MSAARDGPGMDTVKTQAAFRDSWIERRTSTSLDREQALHITEMQNQRAFAAARGASDPDENVRVDVMGSQSQNAYGTSASSVVKDVGVTVEIHTQLNEPSGIAATDASNERRHEHRDEASYAPSHPTQYGMQASSSMNGCVEASNEYGESDEVTITDAIGESRPVWFCGKPREWPRR